MRKIYLLLTLFLSSIEIYSQDYLINFTGSGLMTGVDSVRVENLTNSTVLSLLGLDTLHLINQYNGINENRKMNSEILFSPNPISNQSFIKFHSPFCGEFSFEVYDISGKLVIKSLFFLSQGIQTIKILGIQEGVYILNIKGLGYIGSLKFISTCYSETKVNLEYIGSIIMDNILITDKTLKVFEVNKSITLMIYSDNDTLRFTGYSGSFFDVIDESPRSNMTINFNFITNMQPPVLTTINASSISETTSSSGGIITSDGGTPVTSRGVCWDTMSNPTIFCNHTTDGGGIGTFTSNISGLIPATTYYLRAYATNRISTSYGNQINFTTRPAFICGTTVTDIDGNQYNTIDIFGLQCWMKENLKTTKYRDGTPIDSGQTAWWSNTSGAYAFYLNNVNLRDTYGVLYNGYAVETGIICPPTWHVPGDGEWSLLMNLVGGLNVAGGKLKESGFTHWNSPNYGAIDQFGFTALPGGYRYTDGTFLNMGSMAYWWSLNPIGCPDCLEIYYASADNGEMFKYYLSAHFGLSVRCVKD